MERYCSVRRSCHTRDCEATGKLLWLTTIACNAPPSAELCASLSAREDLATARIAGVTSEAGWSLSAVA